MGRFERLSTCRLAGAVTTRNRLTKQFGREFEPIDGRGGLFTPMVSIGAALALLIFLARFVSRRAALYAGAMLIMALPLRVNAWPGLAAGSHDFAAIVPRLAYAFAPWTPLVPLVFVRPRRPTRWRVALAIAVIVAVAADVFLHQMTLAPFAIAAATGAALDDLDPQPRLELALVVGALGFLVAHDLALEPDRVLEALNPSLAHGHAADAAHALRLATGAVAVLAVIALALRPSWMPVAIVAGAVASLFLRVHAYPAVLARVSPAPMLDAWESHSRPGDELAGLGVDAGSQRLEAETAAAWLGDDASARRFVLLTAVQLPRLNAAYRAREHANVPVLAGKDGAFLIAVNRLDGDELSQNPLATLLPAAPPTALRPVDAKLESLDVLGWEVVDEKPKHVRIALRVSSKTPLRGFCTFLHIDPAHGMTRFNAEHRDEIAVPISDWRDGDIVSGAAKDGHDRVRLGLLEVK